MNMIYHAATGVVLSQAVYNTVIPEIVIAAALPDLIGSVPNICIRIIDAISQKGLSCAQKIKYVIFHATFYNKFDKFMYRFSHSLLGVLFFGPIFYVLYPKVYLALIGAYLIHLAVDIPLHKGFWGTRLLYPFSDIYFNGIDWWLNKKIFLTMWLALIGILVTLMLF